MLLKSAIAGLISIVSGKAASKYMMMNAMSWA
jgi:hypothetical protein